MTIRYNATNVFPGSSVLSRNWGDAINPYLFEKLAGRPPRRVFLPISNPDKGLRVLLMAGSILSAADVFTGVWGTGFISNIARGASRNKPLKVYAVRGPLTRELLLKREIECPEVYGDPALLFPKFYKPNVEKKYKFGIVPHYIDRGHPWLKRVGKNPNIRIINILDGVLEFVDAVCSCQRIISSSLHGLVCADAYGIPAVWVEFSNKVVGAGFKFRDYFLSIGRNDLSALRVDSETKFSLVASKFYDYKVDLDLEKLLEACPLWKPQK